MFASPVSVIANKSYSKANLKKDEFSVSGKTSMGEIISNAFSKYGSDEAVDQNTSIKDVTSSNNVVTINLTNKEDCSVLVGIYDEKTLNLIADSIKKVKSSDDQSVTISFDEKLPENYIVKAVAVDKNNEAICNVYTDNDNTEWYKEFISSTIDDYSKKKVINFDNSNDDNFARERLVQVQLAGALPSQKHGRLSTALLLFLQEQMQYLNIMFGKSMRMRP